MPPCHWQFEIQETKGRTGETERLAGIRGVFLGAVGPPGDHPVFKAILQSICPSMAGTDLERGEDVEI